MNQIESSIGYEEDTGRYRYLGYLNGEAVGTSMLTLNSGVGGIHGVSTIPNERGKGIGTLMSLFTLKETKRNGYFVGILRASRMGVNIYEKIGFRKYSHVDVYNWGLSTYKINNAYEYDVVNKSHDFNVGNVDITTTEGALIVSRLTSTEITALSAANGMIVYNTTTNAFNFYENGSWVTK